MCVCVTMFSSVQSAVGSEHTADKCEKEPSHGTVMTYAALGFVIVSANTSAVHLIMVVVVVMTAAAFGIMFMVFVIVTIACAVAIFMIVFRHGSLLLLSALVISGLFRFRIELEPDLFLLAL